MSKPSGDTRLRQKKSRCKTSFEFGEEELTYTFDNAHTKVGSTVPYHKIPDRMSYREVRLWWLKYTIIFYLTLCTITVLYYKSIDDIQMMYCTVYFSTIALLVIWFLGLRRHIGGMTSMPLNPALVILHDGRQQQIIDEIMRRRLKMMKSKLAQIDYNHPYYEEASKFIWLKEEGVISDKEYKEARQKIAGMRDKAALLPPHGPGNVN